LKGIRFFALTGIICTVLPCAGCTIIKSAETQRTGPQLIRYAQGEFSAINGFDAQVTVTLPQTQEPAQMSANWQGRDGQLTFLSPQWMEGTCLQWEKDNLTVQYQDASYELGNGWDSLPVLWAARFPTYLLQTLQQGEVEEVDGDLYYTFSPTSQVPALTCRAVVEGVSCTPTQLELICGDQVTVLEVESFTPLRPAQQTTQEGDAS
jgi:hypothetical protein